MTMSIQMTDFRNIETDVQAILRLFNQKGCILPIEEQERMRMQKNAVTQMSSGLDSLRLAMETVLDDDEGIALMNLSLLAERPELYGYPLSQEILSRHEEMEELLESYLMDYNSLQVGPLTVAVVCCCCLLLSVDLLAGIEETQLPRSFRILLYYVYSSFHHHPSSSFPILLRLVSLSPSHPLPSQQGKITYLGKLMQSAEEFVSLRLDTARNELLVTNTMFGVLSSCIAFAAYFTGIFGMNLDNTITIQVGKPIIVLALVMSCQCFVIS